MAICPESAITEKQRKIGIAEFGKSNGTYFGHGRLDIGAIQTPAVIRHVKKRIKKDAVNIIDAPPGTSCPVIEAIKGSDFVLLVTEPTPFGLNDLALAVGMVRQLKIPFAVAINRSNIGNDAVVRYCQQENIAVLIQMPNDRKIAESYSRGVMIVEAMPDYKQKFLKLYEDIKKLGKGK
jgi:MinD superfamily P-loop ATPase